MLLEVRSFLSRLQNRHTGDNGTNIEMKDGKMKLNLSKTLYANFLGIYLALALASMYFGSAPATVAFLFYFAAAVSLLDLLLVLFKRGSSNARRISSFAQDIAWSAAFPALICTWFGAALYWLVISYIIIYMVLRFGPDKIAFPRLRGEVIFWSGDY